MDERAGTPAQASDLIDVDALRRAYYDLKPDVSIPEQRVVFGTSGHRGSSLNTAFNEDHIAATTQAIVRVPQQPRASPARCSSARTRTRSASSP